jgi:hypothetical protein
MITLRTDVGSIPGCYARCRTHVRGHAARGVDHGDLA